jgi:cystathionine gamma-lyase
MKTLHVRMREAAGNAIKLARFLESHAMVDRVLYPGLKSHPQHAIAVKQCSGFGAMITFFVKGGISSARAFLTNLKVFTLAESLGAVESLAESPALMTHASVPAEQREKLGIDDSIIRLSVGIEDVDDLLNDVEAALEASRLVKQ